MLYKNIIICKCMYILTLNNIPEEYNFNDKLYMSKVTYLF
jgi:hypothetical protein